MPSPVVQNPPVQTESKSAKKKKAKAERTESPAPSALSVPEKPASVAGQEGQDDSTNPYIRELQKSIRNVNKKIANASKTDAIVEQHKGKSLDDLVNEKIINVDQRAQRLKKPQLESQLAQLEEQLAQYKKMDEEYRTRAAAEKASLEKSLTEKLEKEKADAISELKAQAAAESKKIQHDGLLVLSQFLRLAAARRTEEADAGLDENMALEGVLLNVYSGDENAVSTMIKLIEGSEEKTHGVTGEELQTSFAQVKAAAKAHAAQFAAVEVVAETTEAPLETTGTNGTDPTVAHAGLTEIDTTGTTIQLTNGHSESTPASGLPENAAVGDNAANAAAESLWDANNDLSASGSQDWVQVPRDPTETENGLAATPASTGNVQSWAEDAQNHAENHQPEVRAPTEANDGFHQVQRNRPRGDREGGWRGRGRGDYRGGHRGHGEGRGRGRGRGRGGNRGGRPRTEES